MTDANLTAKTKSKPVTSTKIPGTEVPDVSQAAAESERQKKWMGRVAVSTAVMAAVAAVSSSLGTSNLNGAMFEKITEADWWSQYQSKGIKHAVLESRIEVFRAAGKTAAEVDTANLARYADEQKSIYKDAMNHQALANGHLRRSATLSYATTAAQIGLALAAIALLVRNNIAWALALIAGAVAAVYLTLGLLS